MQIALAFLITRTLLLTAGLLAGYFPMNPARVPDPMHSYVVTPVRSLDIWARADSTYYFKIVTEDYQAAGPLDETQTEWAFFPLYPYLLRILVTWIHEFTQSFELFLFGVFIFDNAILVAAAMMLYKLVDHHFQNLEYARGAVWMLMAFPTSFFLSAMYAEGLFLLLAIGGMYAISLKKWAVASLIASLIAITKPMGIAFWIVLLLAYPWKDLKVKEVAWFLAIPVGLTAFLCRAYWVTGDLLAPLSAQAAWEKTISLPWETFSNKSHQLPQYLLFEKVLFLTFPISVPFMFIKLPKHMALYGTLVMTPIILSGSMMGFGRHLILAFPLFVLLGMLPKRFHIPTLVSFMIIQCAIMAGWANRYDIW